MDKPQFRPFNQHKAVVVYRRQLPHWRQDGACYFVTYRLNDSIPANILAGWKEEREIWLNAHGIDLDMLQSDEWRDAYEKIAPAERRKFKRRHHRQLNDCLDAEHGSCCLRTEEHAQIALDALLFFHGKRCWMGDAVIMPNHVHALFVPMDGYNLERLLQSIKRYSAREINNRMGKDGRLWQKDSYDHIVRNKKELNAFRKYIAKNASQAGLKQGNGAYHQADWLDDVEM